MKAKLNLLEIVNQRLGETPCIPATIDVREVFDFMDADHEIEIDVHQLLDENRHIAHIWGIDDVRHLRPDLSADQAWEVLQTVERRLNSEFGINWDFIRDTADELYPKRDLPPDPECKNDDRAAWAGKAIAIFRKETGTDDHDALCDLLCDLMHWADRVPHDFESALNRARYHYGAETGADQ